MWPKKNKEEQQASSSGRRENKNEPDNEGILAIDKSVF